MFRVSHKYRGKTHGSVRMTRDTELKKGFLGKVHNSLKERVRGSQVNARW